MGSPRPFDYYIMPLYTNKCGRHTYKHIYNVQADIFLRKYWFFWEILGSIAVSVCICVFVQMSFVCV